MHKDYFPGGGGCKKNVTLHLLYKWLILTRKGFISPQNNHRPPTFWVAIGLQSLRSTFSGTWGDRRPSLHIVRTGSLPVRAWCESPCICESESSTELAELMTRSTQHPRLQVDLWLYLGSPGCRTWAGWGCLLPQAVWGWFYSWRRGLRPIGNENDSMGQPASSRHAGALVGRDPGAALCSETGHLCRRTPGRLKECLPAPIPYTCPLKGLEPGRRKTFQAVKASKRYIPVKAQV